MNSVSPELIALLAACRARPADDLPRLVLADWLDENGQSERAEFVRIQVELSHPTADTLRTRTLKSREKELLETHFRSWVGDLHEIAWERRILPATPIPVDYTLAGLKIPVRFHRGLLRVDYAPSLNREIDSKAIAWLRSPHRHWLEQVGLSYGTPEQFVKADLPDELSGTIALSLNAFRQAPPPSVREHFRLLAVSSNFTAVRSLWVYGIPKLPIVEELARADVSRLHELHLSVGVSESQLQDVLRVAEVLASAPFSSLSSIDIGPLTEPALRALIRSPHLGNLVHLNLIGGHNGSPLGDSGMVALCGSKLANTLRAVEFPNTGIGDAGVRALTLSPLLANLHGPRLNLMMNRIGGLGLKALAECRHLVRFRELVLRENQVDDEGVVTLAASPHAANLQYLDFWRNRLTDRGAIALAGSPYLNKVVDLCVKENQITEAGAAILHERFGEAVKT